MWTNESKIYWCLKIFFMVSGRLLQNDICIFPKKLREDCFKNFKAKTEIHADKRLNISEVT